jgi:hypothetical protein
VQKRQLCLLRSRDYYDWYSNDRYRAEVGADSWMQVSHLITSCQDQYCLMSMKLCEGFRTASIRLISDGIIHWMLESMVLRGASLSAVLLIYPEVYTSDNMNQFILFQISNWQKCTVAGHINQPQSSPCARRTTNMLKSTASYTGLLCPLPGLLENT